MNEGFEMKEHFADMLDYLQWRGDLSFDESPFCAVDALVLCQLSYIHLDGLVDPSFEAGKTLAAIYKDFTDDSNYIARCDVGAVINPKTIDLFAEAVKTKRFGEMTLCGYQTILNEERIEQFAAMVFIIDHKNAIVVFRGTDDTFVGWHEDFNLTYLDNIPSQLSGVEYLNKVEKAFGGKILVAGHSKGGNVAVYASVYCNKGMRKKISDIYNFDGPGFGGQFFVKKEYREQESKLHSFYPQFSVVGMTFYHPKEFKIVDSSGQNVFQHDAFSWNIRGSSFVFREEFTDESKFFYVAFNDWMDDMSKEDLKKFTQVFFNIAYASGVKTNRDLEKNKRQASKRILSEITKLDSESKKHVVKIIHMLLTVGRENIPLFNIFQGKGILQDELRKIEDVFGKIGKKEEIDDDERDD